MVERSVVVQDSDTAQATQDASEVSRRVAVALSSQEAMWRELRDSHFEGVPPILKRYAATLEQVKQVCQ
jgi:hypothetical protein